MMAKINARLIGLMFVIFMFIFALVQSRASAGALPKMRETPNLECAGSNATLDLYAPLEAGKFPIMVTIGLSKASQITGEPNVGSGKKKSSKSKSKSKKASKPQVQKTKSKKKGKSGKKQVTMKNAVELFFTLQGYVVANLRPGPFVNVSALARDIACAVEKAKTMGGIPEDVFLLSRGTGARDILELGTTTAAVKMLPGLLGVIGIEPVGRAVVGKPFEFMPHIFLVDSGKSEEDVAATPMGRKFVEAQTPVRFGFAHRKSKGDLASELGMATDVVTRDVMDFVRGRIRSATKSTSGDALTSATPAPSGGEPKIISTPDSESEEP